MKTLSSSRERAKENSCDQDILNTLSYRNVFKCSMNEFQLYTFLISKKHYEPEFFKKSLRRLLKSKKLNVSRDQYFIYGTKPLSSNLRKRNTSELLNETKKYLGLFSYIPWIKMLAITGSVAVENAKKDDDIDIFIISTKNRLWITRFFTFIILKIANKYAQGENSNKKFCCNLFVDESTIKWPVQNIFTAHEIISVIPLINKENTYEKFLNENIWALGYFKNFRLEFPKFKKKTSRHAFFGDFLDLVAYLGQTFYMSRKKTVEKVNKHLAHFNKNDHSKEILSKFSEYTS